MPVTRRRNSLARHVQAGWGELDEQDRRENERSLVEDCRLLSAYHPTDGAISTEARRPQKRSRFRAGHSLRICYGSQLFSSNISNTTHYTIGYLEGGLWTTWLRPRL